MKRWVPIVLLLLALVLLTGCLKYKTVPVMAEMVQHEYYPSYTDMVMVPHTVSTGKSTTTVMVPQMRHHPERFYVTIRYNGLFYNAESHDLYESFAPGATVQATLHEGYDKDGIVQNRYITWP